MNKVKKAVLPVAGFGTRFLPITKGISKELLPIVDKAGIQYIVEEAVASGIEEFVFVVGKHNEEDLKSYFGATPELDKLLSDDNKQELLAVSKYLENLAKINFVRQSKPLGLANAIYQAKPFIKNEPFAVLLGDELIYTQGDMRPCIGQLIDCYNKTGCVTLGAKIMEKAELKKYGNLGISSTENGISRVYAIKEKPKTEAEILSSRAIIGRYVVNDEIFGVIEKLGKQEPSKQVLFTDALLSFAASDRLVSYDIEGKRYDTGDKLGYLTAVVEYAMRDEKLGKDFTEFLRDLEIDEVK